MRDDITYFLCEAAASCGARVLGLAVMPNHFHLVVKQGSAPLGWMMQRAMQRTVHLVKRVQRASGHDVEGHIFGRRYWSAVCPGPDYLRHAIIYAHLNAWAAGLCGHPDRYRWSAHNLVRGATPAAPWQSLVATEEARLLFAHDSVDPVAITRNYGRFVYYAMLRRRDLIEGRKFIFAAADYPAAPHAQLGDRHWAATYSHAVTDERPTVEKIDVRDRAVAVLRKLDANCHIDLLRHAGRVRGLCRIRRELIAALLSYGYKGAAIARCLRVSQSVVSDVVRTIRPRVPPAP